MEKGQNCVRKYALEWRESDPGRGEHLNNHPGRIKDPNLYPPWLRRFVTCAAHTIISMLILKELSTLVSMMTIGGQLLLHQMSSTFLQLLKCIGQL